MAKLRVGSPEEDADITPVVSESSANFIEGLVEDARQKGAKFLTQYRRWVAEPPGSSRARVTLLWASQKHT